LQQGGSKVNRLILVPLVFCLIIASWQCIDPIYQPILPTWDADVSLPLGSQQYTLIELVDKNPGLIRVDETGMLIYSFSDTTQHNPFGDVLRLEVEPADFSFEVGLFTLSPSDVDFDVAVGDYIGLPPGYSGPSSGVLPTPLSGTMPAVESLHYMVAKSGSVSLSFTNKSGVPIEIPNGVTVTNTDDGSVVGHFFFPGVIEPGDSTQSTIALENTRIFRTMAYQFSFSNPPAESVNIPYYPVLAFTVEFKELQANEAEAQLPSQTLANHFEGTIVIDDSTYISRVDFMQGTLELFIQNTADIDIPVTIIFPDLRAKGNQSRQYSTVTTLSRRSVNTLSLDLKNWVLHNSDLTNSLVYRVQPGTIDATPDYRTIHASDAIDGHLKCDESPSGKLVVERIEGVIPPTRYEVSEYVHLGIGDVANFFEGSVQFKDVQMSLGLRMAGGFDALANLRIIGENRYGVRDSLFLPADQSYISAGGWANIIMSKTNSAVVDFVNSFIPHLPEKLLIAGELIVNPGYAAGSIDVRDVLTTSVRLDVPFDFGIRDGMVRDTLLVGDKDADLDREIFDYLNYGRIYFETENGLPIEVDLRINLLDKNGVAMRQIPVQGEPPVSIKAAPVDSQGFATGTTGRDIRVLDLTREDIRVFRDCEMTELILYLNTNNETDTVVFRSQDSIRVNIFTTFSVKANFN
jgi:hypothetical protein